MAYTRAELATVFYSSRGLSKDLIPDLVKKKLNDPTATCSDRRVDRICEIQKKKGNRLRERKTWSLVNVDTFTLKSLGNEYSSFLATLKLDDTEKKKVMPFSRSEQDEIGSALEKDISRHDESTEHGYGFVQESDTPTKTRTSRKKADEPRATEKARGFDDEDFALLYYSSRGIPQEEITVLLERVFNKRPVRDTLPAVRLRIQDICDEQKKRGNPLREGTTWFLRKVNEFISSRTGDYCTEFIQLLALQDHEKDELRARWPNEWHNKFRKDLVRSEFQNGTWTYTDGDTTKTTYSRRQAPAPEGRGRSADRRATRQRPYTTKEKGRPEEQGHGRGRSKTEPETTSMRTIFNPFTDRGQLSQAPATYPSIASGYSSSTIGAQSRPSPYVSGYGPSDYRVPEPGQPSLPPQPSPYSSITGEYDPQRLFEQTPAPTGRYAVSRESERGDGSFRGDRPRDSDRSSGGRKPPGDNKSSKG